MVVGVCTIRLALPGNDSLKGKRSILKSLLARLRHEFNVSTAEVGDNEVWQSAIVGVAAISSDAKYLHGLLTHVVDWVDNSHYDIEVVGFDIELQ